MKYYNLNGKIARDINNIVPNGCTEVILKDEYFADFCKSPQNYKIEDNIVVKISKLAILWNRIISR